MPEPEQLSLLIGHIYDAALNPKLQLRESANAIRQIAHAMGYTSEEAFKREFGLSPTQWKEQNSELRTLA